MRWTPHIVFEDNHLLVIEKPSGLLAQGDHTGDPNVFDLLKEYIKIKYNKPGNVYLGSVHRLDRPVSGLMLFAKSSKAAARLQKMMESGEIHKKYLAICEGHPEKDEAHLEHYLLKDEKVNKTRVYDLPRPNAKKSGLKYRLLANIHSRSLIEIELVTGRSHQIRAQMAYIGCPIFGDYKYGKLRQGQESDLALYAYSLSFIHPVSKNPVNLKLYPTDKEIWKAFRPFLPR